MKLPEYEFSGLGWFVDFIEKHPNKHWVFRGQSKIEEPLLPKAGRPAYRLKLTNPYKRGDLGRFDRWRHQAVAFSEQLPENEFECLAFAQHYGLATRLLDWTANPLVALFFATEKHRDDDGGVFFYRPAGTVKPEQKKLRKFSNVMLYKPRPIDQRILAQDGVLTFHSEPEKILEPRRISPDKTVSGSCGFDLFVVRVLAKQKEDLQRRIRDFGMHRRILFPDLDGLSESINWTTRRISKDQQKPR